MTPVVQDGPRRDDVRHLASILQQALAAQAEVVEMLTIERIRQVDEVRRTDLARRLRTLAAAAGAALLE